MQEVLISPLLPRLRVRKIGELARTVEMSVAIKAEDGRCLVI